MNVLMTADTVGGVWTYAMELARGLSKHGTRVVLATMGPLPDPAQRAQAQTVPGLTLESAPYRLEWMEDPWDDVARAGSWLLDLAGKHDVDLIHLNGYAHAPLDWTAPVAVVGHSCVVGWWHAVHGRAPPPAWNVYRAAVAEGLRAADLVITPSRAMLDTLQRHHGIDASRARVIPNARSPPPQRFVSRKHPHVLAVGRVWDEAKGIETLDVAAERLAWPVRVVGEARPPEGEASSRRLRHAKALGRLDDARLEAAYAGAAVFVSPARYEPFGLNVLEAAHAGCALVLSDIRSFREIWGDAAAYFEVGDADALRDALERVCHDRALRWRLSLAAKRRAMRLTQARQARDYDACYRTLVARQEESPFAS